MKDVPLPEVFRDMTSKDLARILRANNAANFVEMVDTWDPKIKYTILTQEAFYGEPDLLYVAIRYASLNGVTLLFAPEVERASDVTK